MSLLYKHCNETKHLECLPKHPSGQLNFLKCFPSSPFYEWATNVTMPTSIGEFTNHDMLHIWILYGNAPTSIPLL
jgi:hypothetical protein